MKSLSERKNKIEDFFGIESEQERENLIKELRAYTESKPEQEIIIEIRTNFEQKIRSGISVMYEVLSKNPKKWSQFYLEEYERAFKKGAKSENPYEIINCLEEICFVGAEKMNTRAEIILLLENYISHERVVMRYQSISYLGDWINLDNKHEYSKLIDKIIAKLKNENWRVKYISELFLSEINELPKSFKHSFIDRMRMKFLSPSNF